ncbi:DUF262 domain-containing protein [Streptomyces sp. NPDC005963]|uniref:DUF262 domain-containing protein n=1 Tax=Streptomyces sp. NPDC005963 TaxID=3156721 RepID=UPI0033E77533
MAEAEDDGDGRGAARSRPAQARGPAMAEDLDQPDSLFLSLGPAIEIGSDGRPTGVELELPDDGDDEHGGYRDADGISAPFRPESISIRTETSTVDLLLSRLRQGMLDLAPDFQRRSGIWSDRAQSRLIESLLLRIPISNLHMAQGDEDRWAVVDGVQRLTAIARFMDPGLTAGLGPLALRGMDYLWQLDGSTYQDLSGRLKIRLRETQLTVHIMQQGTPEAVKFNVFSRINTGGMPLSPQELRHALVSGPVRGYLADLAEDPAFGEATRWSVSDARMADREMVLRFLAFRTTNPVEHTEKDFDKFLVAAMYRVNALPKDRWEQLAREFRTALRCAEDLFGKHAFRKWHGGERSSPVVNKALFEAVSVNLALLDDHERNRLVASRATVRARFVELMGDWDFERSISVSTGDPARIRTRFQEVARLFRGVAEQ